MVDFITSAYNGYVDSIGAWWWIVGWGITIFLTAFQEGLDGTGELDPSLPALAMTATFYVIEYLCWPLLLAYMVFEEIRKRV